MVSVGTGVAVDSSVGCGVDDATVGVVSPVIHPQVMTTAKTNAKSSIAEKILVFLCILFLTSVIG